MGIGSLPIVRSPGAANNNHAWRFLTSGTRLYAAGIATLPSLKKDPRGRGLVITQREKRFDIAVTSMYGE